MTATTLSAVIKWAKEKGIYHKRDLTHVSMAGGSFSIPMDQIEEFYTRYEYSLQKREHLYIVEIKTEFFRFFIDMDYISEQILEEQELSSIIRCIVQTVQRLLVDPSQGSCVVCLPNKIKTLEKEGYKHGAHLIFYDTVMDHTSASLLSKQVVIDLERAFGPRTHQPWDSVIDPSVYRSKTGLRMKYSNKPGEEGRVYKPVTVMKPDEEFPFQGTTIDALRLCSIRTRCGDLTQIKKEEIEKDILDREEELHVETRDGAINEEDAIVDPVHVQTLQGFLQVYYPKHRVQSVRKVLKVHNRDKFVIFVGSRYCINLGRTHNSNNVYFIATKDGVSQRCFCTCKTTKGRMYGECSQFESKPIPLNESLKKVLFSKKSPVVEKPQGKNVETLTKWDISNDFLNALMNK